MFFSCSQVTSMKLSNEIKKWLVHFKTDRTERTGQKRIESNRYLQESCLFGGHIQSIFIYSQVISLLQEEERNQG